MKKVIVYSLGGLLFFILALLLTVPAKRVYAWSAEQLTPLQLAGVHGNLWQGLATDGRYDKLNLSNIKWDFHPSALLALGLNYSVSAKLPDGNASTDIDVGLGSTTFTDLILNSPLANIARAIKQPENFLAGQVNALFERIELQDNLPVFAEGRIVVTDTQQLFPKPNPLGDYHIDVSTGDGMITGILADAGNGPLKLAGRFELNPDSSIWELKGTVALRDHNNKVLRSFLNGLGRPDAAGNYPLTAKGQLRKPEAAPAKP